MAWDLLFLIVPTSHLWAVLVFAASPAIAVIAAAAAMAAAAATGEGGSRGEGGGRIMAAAMGREKFSGARG